MNFVLKFKNFGSESLGLYLEHMFPPSFQNFFIPMKNRDKKGFSLQSGLDNAPFLFGKLLHYCSCRLNFCIAFKYFAFSMNKPAGIWVQAYVKALPPYVMTLPHHVLALPPYVKSLPPHVKSLPPYVMALPPHVIALPPHVMALPHCVKILEY